MRGALRLAVLIVGAQSAATEPFVFRDPESAECKAISNGIAQGVVIGTVKQRDGGPIPSMQIFSLALTVDGGRNVRCLNCALSSTRANSEGQFFLIHSGGRRCLVAFGSSDFEARETTVDCQTRTCVEVTLDPSDAGQ